MNDYENKQQQAPNADDFLGGNYLKKEDIGQPTTVTVTNVWTEAVLNAERKKLMISFREFEKPLILNKTNIKRMARIFETGDTAAWRGPVILYVEAGVEYAGRVVGGLRVRPAIAASDTRGSNTEQTQRMANGHAAVETYSESESDIF